MFSQLQFGLEFTVYPQYAFSLSNQENKFCCICFFKMIFLAAPVPSLWSRIKEFLSASLLVGGIGYAIYQLYKVRTVLVHFLSKKIIVTQCNGDKPLKECSHVTKFSPSQKVGPVLFCIRK